MAKNSKISLRKEEIWGGILYFPFYIALTSMAIQWIFQSLGAPLNLFQLNVAVFAVNFLAIAVIFRHYLAASFRQVTSHFGLLLQAVTLAVVYYLAVVWLFNRLIGLLPVQLENGNNDQVIQMLENHPAVMVMCTCLLASVVEECLFRGLIFGLLREKSRILAYILSTLGFALLHVWAFIGQYSPLNLLLVTASYLPAGLFLGWAFEKSGTIWGSILAHAIINLVACIQNLS